MEEHILIIFLVAVNLCFGQDDAIACSSRDYGYDSTVCVCNATYCDEIPPIKKLESPYYQVYTSNKDGLRFSRTTGQFEEYDYPIFDTKKIVVDKNDAYQTIFGWGGAFTDACTENIKSLDEAVQNKLLRSYFSSVGIEYNVGRVPIGGTDFSKRGYSYCDTETEDILLQNFKLQDEDNNYKIPVIHEALKINNDLKLFASAWIAPKWMKTNNAYNGTGRIKDNMYQVWANYYMKFFDAYKENNITFWGVTTGNEPSLALIGHKIPSNAWDENQMKRWIGDHLGPTIRNSEYKDMKILLLDDQRIFVPWFIEKVFENTTVKDFVDLIAIHWYMDDLVLPVVLDMLNDKYPTKFVMGTEACAGDRPNDTAVELGSWQRGERYASSIIEDMEHHFIGWIDWNMALNTEGGPSYIDNYFDSPIIVNATAGEFYKQPLFYSMGHFSKFVPRGSVRIGMSRNLVGLTIATTAFKRPDGGIVVVLQNKNEEPHDVNLIDEEKGKISLTLAKRSLTTVVYY